MGKNVYKERECRVCDKSYTPTGPKNIWCSLRCRMLYSCDQSGGPTSCWPWLASYDKNGYGEVGIDHSIWFAHRVAYEVLGEKTILPGQVIRHSCDNPACCNPQHLVAGTQADNVRDMIERGRQQDYKRTAVGSATNKNKIDEATAKAIFDNRHRRNDDVAVEFGVSFGIVDGIVNGYNWNHVTGLPRKKHLPTKVKNALPDTAPVFWANDKDGNWTSGDYRVWRSQSPLPRPWSISVKDEIVKGPLRLRTFATAERAKAAAEKMLLSDPLNHLIIAHLRAARKYAEENNYPAALANTRLALDSLINATGG